MTSEFINQQHAFEDNDHGSGSRHRGAADHGAETAERQQEGQKASGGMTVRDATFDLLRSLDMTTIFGNPGSTEEPFLQDFPSDFEYVLGLQEASVVAMADGFAQATKKPVLVNLHTAAGTANGMCSIISAYQNKTPMVITAGQQHRAMLLCEPMLTNRDATTLPKPWVKWSYEPARPEDVPAAIVRAYATALQPPCGPVFVSIPLDDWNHPALGTQKPRTVSSRCAPDPVRIQEFADRISRAKNPVLVYGQEIDRAGGWNAGVEFAERLRAPVFLAPTADRISFPQDHPQFQGSLPLAIGPLSQRLSGFDLVIVIGASVFRYYPYVAGEYLPEGAELLQITNDPNDAAAAAVGDSLLADAKLALEELIDLVPQNRSRTVPAPSKVSAVAPSPADEALPLRAAEVFAALAELRPDDAIVVQESPSNAGELMEEWPTVAPESYFTFASGGLGWDAPAAVGIALAQKRSGSGRPVVAFIGDGALQYSIQALYTAAQLRLKVIFIVPCNGEYAILKAFAELEKTPNVPALDIPGIDIPSLAKGYGCASATPQTREEIKAAFSKALSADGPTVIAIPIKPELRPLTAV